MTEGLPSPGVSTRNKFAFNPFSEAFREDPYPTYRRLREEMPVDRVMGSWILSRYADVTAVLRDRRFSSSRIPDLVKRRGQGRRGAESYHDYKAIESFIAKAIVFTENPDHSRLRRLVNHIFGPAAVEAERSRIERIGRELLYRPIDEGGMDLVADFADKLPMYLMCERLGVGRDMGPALRDWAHDARLLLDPTFMSKDDFVRVESVMRQALDFLDGLVRERKQKPGDDVVSILLATRDRDDRLSDDEVALTCIMSFVAGHETTKHLIGNAALAFLRHPNEARRLRSEPDLARNAVDETLRFDAPLQQTKRVALVDVEFRGHVVREGDQVLLLLAAANHDPETFDRPEEFRIDRTNARAHLGFGYGMRACLGGGLAQAEAVAACGLLFCGDIRPQAALDKLDWQRESVILRGLERLPIVLERAHRP